MNEKGINDRIGQLKQEINHHQQELGMAQDAVRQLSQLILSKRGGLTELDKLLHPEKYVDTGKSAGDAPNTPDSDNATTVEPETAPSDPNIKPCPVATSKKAKKNKVGNKKKKKLKSAF